MCITRLNLDFDEKVYNSFRNKFRRWRRKYFDFRHFYYCVVYGVGNLIKWFPIVWQDRNWGWDDIVRILEFKLRDMSDYTGKYGHHVGSEKDAREMLICAELLKRIWLEELSNKDHSLEVYEKQYPVWMEHFCKIFSKKLRSWWN